MKADLQATPSMPMTYGEIRTWSAFERLGRFAKLSVDKLFDDGPVSFLIGGPFRTKAIVGHEALLSPGLWSESCLTFAEYGRQVYLLCIASNLVLRHDRT